MCERLSTQLIGGVADAATSQKELLELYEVIKFYGEPANGSSILCRIKEEKKGKEEGTLNSILPGKATLVVNDT